MTYDEWLENVKPWLGERATFLPATIARTNLHWVYASGRTPEEGAYAVLEVAARHGNKDAKQLIKRNKELFG